MPSHDVRNVDRGPDVEVLENEVPPVPVGWDPEQVEVSSNEDQKVEELCDQGNACNAISSIVQTYRTRVSSPSALLLEWMAHISIHLDAVWDRSPRMRKMFIVQMEDADSDE